MNYRLGIAYALILALATGLCAATAQLQTSVDAGPPAIPVGWVPDWLTRSVNRALADATDPRARDKGTGLPKDAAPK